jgi:hypothetical protein
MSLSRMTVSNLGFVLGRVGHDGDVNKVRLGPSPRGIGLAYKQREPNKNLPAASPKHPNNCNHNYTPRTEPHD